MKQKNMTQHPLLSPIQSGRIFEEVSDRIKELIFEGVYSVGDQLPSEGQLAETFNVGRQTVREALRMLEVSGFIKINRGASGGPLITDTIFKKIGGLYVDAFRMKHITFEDLTVARFSIEKIIIERIVDRLDEKWLKKLRQNISKAQKKAAQNLRTTQENMDFHRLLAQATGNHVFVIVLESLLAIQGGFLVRLPPEVKITHSVTLYHEMITDALENRDKDKAFLLLEEHLLEIETRLKRAAGSSLK
jgi:GntR family transcriptional regulator, transcriptional repressor for pyruvate dehydrogenase complex